jgi:hypothetical protein
MQDAGDVNVQQNFKKFIIPKGFRGKSAPFLPKFSLWKFDCL